MTLIELCERLNFDRGIKLDHNRCGGTRAKRLCEAVEVPSLVAMDKSR